MSTDKPTQNTTVLDECEAFLRRYYEEEVYELANNYPNDQRSIEIDWMDLYQYDTGLAQDLRDDPRRIKGHLEEALATMDLPADVELRDANARITNVPPSDTFNVDETRADHVGQYVAISGQVKKTSKIKPKPIQLTYVCERCGTPTTIPQTDLSDLQSPHECQGCERQGPFTTDYEQSEFTDHQLIRVKQPPEETKGGSGQHIDVHLQDDLVGEVDGGDRATIAGILSMEEPSDGNITYTPYLEGEAVEIDQTDYEDIDVSEYREEIEAIANGERGDPYDLLIDSIAPKISGYDHIKEAIILQMFGGSTAEYPYGTKDRGDSHILLLGDPGTAKSSLLNAVEKLAPRSTYASGKGASAAGMTAAAVSDDFGDSKWSLEAGALVVANKGIACVDEIDKVDEDAVSSLHGALEKQEVHVNKAGINTTLPAETALLAAGNPEYGRFDPNQPFVEQIDLGPTLLSRFDLIFLLSDSPDEESDREIADQMIRSRQLAIKNQRSDSDLDDEELEEIEPALDAELMRAYIAHAKQSVTPAIEDQEIHENLRDSFVALRTSNGEDPDAPVPVTHRKLEGHQRLAEASARVRLSDTIETQDVERAKRIIGESMSDVGKDAETNQFDADIVEADVSNSQRNRMEYLQDLIPELQEDQDAGVAIEEVVDVMEENGFSERQVKNSIQTLKDKGHVYNPEEGRIAYLR